jgi:hypothetical protein
MPIMRKSEVYKCFKEFRISFEKQYGTTIKSIHSDNGGEYTLRENNAKKKGIQVTRAAPYAPESNGIAERMNRTLVEAVRTMLAQSGLPARFWVEAIRYAVKIRNLFPRDNGLPLYQELTGKTPDLSAFRPFECLGKVHSYRKGSQKLSSKSTPCVLLCTLNHRNYRLYDLKTRKVLTTPNVLFTENAFPAKSANTPCESDLVDASSDSSSGLDIFRIVVTGTEFESDDSSSSDSSDTQDLYVSSTTSEDTENEQS